MHYIPSFCKKSSLNFARFIPKSFSNSAFCCFNKFSWLSRSSPVVHKIARPSINGILLPCLMLPSFIHMGRDINSNWSLYWSEAKWEKLTWLTQPAFSIWNITLFASQAKVLKIKFFFISLSLCHCFTWLHG